MHEVASFVRRPRILTCDGFGWRAAVGEVSSVTDRSFVIPPHHKRTTNGDYNESGQKWISSLFSFLDSRFSLSLLLASRWHSKMMRRCGFWFQEVRVSQMEISAKKIQNHWGEIALDPSMLANLD